MIDYGRESIPDIYNYYTFSSYFTAILDHFKNAKIGPKSYGQWTKRLGYKSPRSFGMVASGQRLPSEEMIYSLCKYLHLDNKKRSYLDTLIAIEKRKKKDKPVDDLLIQIKKINPKNSSFEIISEKDFSHISKWYYLVIRQILKYEIHESEINKVYEGLAGKVPLKEVKIVVKKLIELKLVSKSRHGMLETTKYSFNTTSDIPSSVIVDHHRGMIKQSLEHLKDEVAAREYQSLTFRCSQENINEAKEAIRQFKEEFNKKFSSEHSEEVYQLNMQFFKHTIFSDLENETDN